MNYKDRVDRHMKGGKYPIQTYRFHPRDIVKAVNIMSELTEGKRDFTVSSSEQEIVISFTGEPL